MKYHTSTTLLTPLLLMCVNGEDLKLILMVKNLVVKLNDWLKKEQFFNEQKN